MRCYTSIFALTEIIYQTIDKRHLSSWSMNLNNFQTNKVFKLKDNCFLIDLLKYVSESYRIGDISLNYMWLRCSLVICAILSSFGTLSVAVVPLTTR